MILYTGVLITFLIGDDILSITPLKNGCFNRWVYIYNNNNIQHLFFVFYPY